MTKILGLTGGIASGKTTVSNHFKSLGIDVMDADLIAREVMKAGQPVVREIANEFGEKIVLPSGEINRERLGAIIFGSEGQREKLNNLVQDKIRAEIKNKKHDLLKNDPRLIVLDIPLLYEEKYENEVDEVMLIYVDEETQKERLMLRNSDLTEEEALNRIQSQMPLSEKREKANFIIDNNGSLKETIRQVNNWLRDECGFKL